WWATCGANINGVPSGDYRPSGTTAGLPSPSLSVFDGMLYDGTLSLMCSVHVPSYSMLSVFDGMLYDGTWTLHISDNANIDTGTLNSFKVESVTTHSTCGPTCGSADFDCDGDTGTDFDIQAFFACLGGSCPPPPC